MEGEGDCVPDAPGQRMQSSHLEDKKARSATSGRWETELRQEPSASAGKIPANLTLLSDTIRANNLGRASILKSTKRHLKQIILEYEALDLEMPCIRKFERPPTAQPLTLCMECAPEKDFSHLDIMKAVEQIVPKAFENKRVCKLQFENVNVICGTAGRKNRWLITVLDFQTRNLFLRSGLTISSDFFPLRRHDDVTMEDYKLHLRRALARKKILDMLRSSADEGRLDSLV
ncbi:putative uncharacterized protein C19orf81 homolog [Ambystoma mexicanum]|uniref:putative uncharacterized protein C19orf81 homolog n=1 Tax=Ambystoma mexicanum TaxID=8296 RepID=UPI0037E906FE